MIDMWEGCLRATGGALVPNKSCWYAIDFKWENEEWIYLEKEEIDVNIWVQHEEREEKIKLKRMEFNAAFETLGVFIAPDGNLKEEKKKLMKVAKEFGESLRENKVSREEAWYATKTTILKTLEYPMEAISLEKKDWEEIYGQFLRYVLPKSGINRHFPRQVVFMSSDYLGLDLIHP